MYAPKGSWNDGLMSEVVKRTDGVSAAFIKEFMRRATQCMIERQTTDRTEASGLTHSDLDLALNEMLFKGGLLNRKLLGARIESIGD